MKKIQHIILAMLVMFAVSACQDKDYDIAAPVLSPLDAEQITGQMIGDDYIWSWGNPDNYSMQVSRYENGTFVGTETVEGNSYTQERRYKYRIYLYIQALRRHKCVAWHYKEVYPRGCFQNVRYHHGSDRESRWL